MFRGFRLILATLFIVSIQIPSRGSCAESDCLKWFKEVGLRRDDQCLDICQLKGLNPNPNYVCVSQCRQLCAGTAKNPYKYRFSTATNAAIYYPGLNNAEKKLIKENPVESIKVFVEKNKAEYSTQRIFPKGAFNDESDAVRHFLWAGMLTKELGAERAKIYLDAHESDPDNPANEKAMDLANNRAGILSTLKLIGEGRYSDEALLGEAIKELREKRLIVLKPGLAIPENHK